LVLPKLLPLKGDAAIGPWVEDALEDIRFFLRVQCIMKERPTLRG